MDVHGSSSGGNNSPSSSSAGLYTNEVAAYQKIKPEASKKRKVIQKAAVATVMKVVESSSTSYVKHKSEGPPSDSWSWRKYGQKPIKGSPFPRGYYRCSTSKGCSAKKQVERCKTNSSMIIITYTSDHNHPSPHHLSSSSSSSSITNPSHLLSEHQELPITPKKEYQDPEEEEEQQQHEEPHTFHYFYPPQSPFNSSLIIRDHEEDPFGLDKSVLNFDGEPDHLSLEPSDDDDDQLLLPTVTSDQENFDGFFNELEELPIFTSSSFSRFMRRSLFHHDRILVHPS